jgi:DNA-binding FadR family transcriptional regulator
MASISPIKPVSRKASPEILAKHNRRFHVSICKTSGNHFSEEYLNQLSQMMVLLGAFVYSMESRLASILAEHEKINNATQKSQPDAAEQAMSVHLEAGLIARLHLISQAEHLQMD